MDGSIAAIVALGFGTFGSVNLVPTLGFGIGEVVAVSPGGFVAGNARVTSRVLGTVRCAPRALGAVRVVERVEGDAEVGAGG